MWNAVILPIFTSVTATGLGILAVWLYNRKRNDDKITNEITRIINEISGVKGQMENGFERITLEKEAVLIAFDSTKKEFEQANKDAVLNQKEFYQLIVDRLQAETQKHEDLRVRVDQNIIETQKQMNTNINMIRSATNMIKELHDDFRKSQNISRS